MKDSISKKLALNGSSFSLTEKVTRISDLSKSWIFSQDSTELIDLQATYVNVKTTKTNVEFLFTRDDGSGYSVSDRIKCKWPWLLVVRDGSPDFLLSKDKQGALVIALPSYTIAVVPPIPVVFKKWESWDRYPAIP